MSLFFETIRIQNRIIHNRTYHNARLNRTISEIFGIMRAYDIAEYITLPADDAIYRCKLVCDTQIRDVTLTPYTPRSYRSFQCIEADISYPCKALERTTIDSLFARRGDADDIIIVKEGLLTDTSIANIALYDGLVWYTPASPLLEGTMRASLLDQKRLKPKALTPKDLQKCVGFAIMNAMTGFYQLKNITFRL